MQKSEGHLCFDARYEYFVYEGEVYRSPVSCPIRCDIAVRNGARWFARSVQAAQALFSAHPQVLTV